jgi:SAM-dependent methyltransferase
LSTALPRLYDEFATWWPLLSAPADYAEEAAFFRDILMRARAEPARTLLELGSGGGNNASHLKPHFRMTLVDRAPGMLAVSRQLNPECEHVEGDMRTVRLGRLFDAVFIHDAITYLTTAQDLQQAMETAFVHCRPCGAVLFVPDCVRETFQPAARHGGHDGEGRALRYLEWTWDPDPSDTTYLVDFAYLLREADGSVRVEHDRHVNGLFPLAEWLRLLREVGSAPRIITDTYDRELFVALRPQPEGKTPMATPEDSLARHRRRQTLLLVAMLAFLVGTSIWQGSVAARRARLNDRLSLAVARNDLAAAHELLRQGADAGAKPADLRVMWHSVRPEFLYNPLRWSRLAEEYRAGRFEAYPVLCGADDAEMVQLLIAHGADPNAEGYLRATALTVAAGYGDARVVKALLAAGAQPNHRTRLGNTALIEAAEALSWPPTPRNPADHHYAAVMQALLEAGADVNARSSMGRTPLSLVKRSGRTRYSYAELLRKAGARE